MSASGSGGKLTVAFLGTGIMGAAMARNAAGAGLRVRGWSIPLADAERLERDGVEPCPSAAAAGGGADLVVTVVPDVKAIESFALGEDGFIPALAADAIWVQRSTVGVAPADRLVAFAAEHGVTIVDSPLLGSRLPAERAELIMLASGEEAAIDRCEPLFEAISRRIVRLGGAGNGSRMKMVTNGWIMTTSPPPPRRWPWPRRSAFPAGASSRASPAPPSTTATPRPRAGWSSSAPSRRR